MSVADFRAITAVTETVISLLRANYPVQNFGSELQFEVYTSKDFETNQIDAGASLFPYRVYVNGANRTPAGRVDARGKRQKDKIPVELHCLITVWGKTASMQTMLAGWIMRTLEDNSILTANLLNAGGQQIFHPDETVQICLAELRMEDLLRIWDVLEVKGYQLSIPYLIRIIEIDAIQPPHDETDGIVQIRREITQMIQG